MSHPMFDRIDRRMEILRRQIAEKRGPNDTVATVTPKPPAPAGILTQNTGRQKPLPPQEP
jgi:hypothetical protein